MDQKARTGSSIPAMLWPWIEQAILKIDSWMEGESIYGHKCPDLKFWNLKFERINVQQDMALEQHM